MQQDSSQTGPHVHIRIRRCFDRPTRRSNHQSVFCGKDEFGAHQLESGVGESSDIWLNVFSVLPHGIKRFIVIVYSVRTRVGYLEIDSNPLRIDPLHLTSQRRCIVNTNINSESFPWNVGASENARWCGHDVTCGCLLLQRQKKMYLIYYHIEDMYVCELLGFG